MIRRGGRAQGRHCIFHAVLRQGHHVHVAFDHDHALLRADGFLRLEQAVEFVAFFEQRCFRRVEIFRFALVQHTPAEADDLAAHVDDGEHDAVTEAVVAFASLAFDHQAGLDEAGILVVGHGSLQVLPIVRRITDAEARGDFTGEAAPFEVVDGARSLFELFAVVARGGLHQVVQIRRDLVLRHIGGFLRHGDADAFRKVFHRFHEAHSGVFHDETDGCAMRTATETVIELLGLTDREGRGFFVMERDSRRRSWHRLF